HPSRDLHLFSLLSPASPSRSLPFSFTATAPTEIYTLSLHDALPICMAIAPANFGDFGTRLLVGNFGDGTISAYDITSGTFQGQRSEEHTSELQSRENLVCRLLLEKKKKKKKEKVQT